MNFIDQGYFYMKFSISLWLQCFIIGFVSFLACSKLSIFEESNKDSFNFKEELLPNGLETGHRNDTVFMLNGPSKFSPNSFKDEDDLHVPDSVVPLRTVKAGVLIFCGILFMNPILTHLSRDYSIPMSIALMLLMIGELQIYLGYRVIMSCPFRFKRLIYDLNDGKVPFSRWASIPILWVSAILFDIYKLDLNLNERIIITGIFILQIIFIMSNQQFEFSNKDNNQNCLISFEYNKIKYITSSSTLSSTA